MNDKKEQYLLHLEFILMQFYVDAISSNVFNNVEELNAFTKNWIKEKMNMLEWYTE